MAFLAFEDKRMIKTVGELVDLLAKFPSDMPVMIPTGINTMVSPCSHGTVNVIPADGRLKPGCEFRVPINARDEEKAERIRVFTIH